MTDLTEKIAALPEMLKQDAKTGIEAFDLLASCAVYKYNCEVLAARNALLCEVLTTLVNSGVCEDCGYQYLIDADVEDARAILAACEHLNTGD